MTLVDQFKDREIYDFVRREDFPVLRYSLAEATIDDAICHVTGANSVTQRKENMRIKYQRLSRLVVAQNIDGIRQEADERQTAYLDYLENQELHITNPFEDLELNMQLPLARHLFQEEQVIVRAVRNVLLPDQSR